MDDGLGWMLLVIFVFGLMIGAGNSWAVYYKEKSECERVHNVYACDRTFVPRLNK